MRSFTALALAQGKAFLRDKQMLFWTIAFPLLFLVLFGGLFAGSGTAKSKVVQVGPVAIFDQLPDESRAEVDAVFTITKSDDRAAALDQVRKGEQDALVEMSGPTVNLTYSQADQVRAATVVGTMDSFVSHANLAMSSTPPTFTMQTAQVEDTSLKAIQYVTPGLLAWAVAMSATFGASITLVEWRKSMLLRRLRLSPIRTSSLVSSRTVLSVSVAMVQTAIFLGVGIGLFGLRLTGAWWAGIPLVLCGTLCFMAIGLLVGAVSRTPDGASLLANLIILPMAFLSGTFIPLEIAPDWMRGLARVLPMGYITEGLTAVMVRGQPPSAVVLPMVVLLGCTLVFGIVAARVLRWDAD